MATLEFNFHKKPPEWLIAVYCDYCQNTIEGAYVEIKLQESRRICIGTCWDNYVVGIAIMNDKVAEFEARKVN